MKLDAISYLGASLLIPPITSKSLSQRPYLAFLIISHKFVIVPHGIILKSKKLHVYLYV